MKPLKLPENEHKYTYALLCTKDEIKAIILEITKKPEAATTDTKDKEISDLKTALATANTKLAEFEKSKTDAERAALDAKIKARKDELGEFAKDMKDEDILDEVKFENAKLKKEVAELKSGKTPKKPEEAKKKPDLVTGGADKNTEDEIKAAAKRVSEMAFGKESKNTEEDKE